MGSAGLVGQIAAYSSMIADGKSVSVTLGLILLMHFILPGLLSFVVAKCMCKLGLLKKGDMKLEM